ncbi:sigma-E factor regulatory protein RseB domain-containing protein [Streptosporangium saharense]|uniref:sigma-E factor regulatory protein RseB domain-containing protein n=1 Tax=Streptosporangium saharense TaxID=1706840 RepID=UPI0033271773
MIRLPAFLAVVIAMVLGLVAGSPARAVQQSVQQGERDNEDTGLRLLREAAVAARGRGYAGTQYVTTWGRSGSFSSMVEVHNVPGRGLSVRSRPSGTAGWVDPGAPAGSMAAPSETMLEVLARNYRVVEAGRASTGGRAARLVNVLRADGTLAARYWLDEAGGLALRRELFDGHGRTVHVGGFLDLTLDPARGGAVAAPAPGGVDLGEVPALTDLGWRFPTELPGRLELFAAHTAPAGYLYLGYSDGLSVVSVFVDSGVLDGEKLRGWHAQRRDGHTIWMRNSVEQGTIWASGDHVYTVFADAPADTVDAAVAALPHEPAPNLWNRLGRGAHRLLSWVNPFG